MSIQFRGGLPRFSANPFDDLKDARKAQVDAGRAQRQAAEANAENELVGQNIQSWKTALGSVVASVAAGEKTVEFTGWDILEGLFSGKYPGRFSITTQSIPDSAVLNRFMEDSFTRADARAVLKPVKAFLDQLVETRLLWHSAAGASYLSRRAGGYGMDHEFDFVKHDYSVRLGGWKLDFAKKDILPV